MHKSLLPLFLTLGSLFTPALASKPLEVEYADTLWKLATKARPDEQVAMVQVVYALWQANPQAFSEKNVHMLRHGAKLSVPSRETMLATPVSEARRWYYEAIEKKPLTSFGHQEKKPVNSASLSANNMPSDNTGKKQHVILEPATKEAINKESVSKEPETNALASSTSSQAATLKAATPASKPKHWQDNLRASHSLSLEQRYYPKDGTQGQNKWHGSLAFSTEWVWQSENRAHQIAFEPYFRADIRDNQRHLIDLRQAYWQYAGNGFDIKAGIDIVFWGVTESQHLVDVINQTDWVASIDGETKLGQSMFNVNLYGEAGTFAFYLLPYFRERTLAGPDGRLRAPLFIDTDNAIYESSDDKNNLDFALRWSRQFGALDLGISYFEGNSREPLLEYASPAGLRPYYLQMQQIGIDSQWIIGSMVWKLESIYRKTRLDDFIGTTFGFEYTQVGLLNSNWDLGWIAEYQYDSRKQNATHQGQNDLFLGARFVANDEAGSEILIGAAQDLDNSKSKSGKIEASMRLTNSLRLKLDAWFFQSNIIGDPLYYIQDDDYIQLTLDYYF